MEGARSAFVTGGSGFVGGALIRRLAREGFRIRALARSERSAAAVAEAGAEPVTGDLQDVAAMEAGAQGCEVAFHAAASVNEWGPWEEFRAANVEGTANALRACAGAGVRRFVHVGTEAAIMAGQPLVDVNEEAPLRPDSKAYCCRSKAMAERIVRRFDRLEAVVMRPRLVWGPGDTTILPAVAEAVEQGRFAWIAGGRHRTSTTHVENVVEGLLLGADRGRPGHAYFVTDGEPLVFRDFLTRLLATRGVELPARSVPAPVARAGALAAEALWRRLPLKGEPPLTRTAVWLASLETTIDISKARSELGYEPVIGVEDGLARLSETSG